MLTKIKQKLLCIYFALVLSGCSAQEDITTISLMPRSVEWAEVQTTFKGDYNVVIQLTETCTPALTQITNELVDRMLAIQVEGETVVAARVMWTIDSGSIVVQPPYVKNQADAEKLRTFLTTPESAVLALSEDNLRTWCFGEQQ